MYESGRSDYTLLPDAAFYEFLPVDAGDDFTQIVTLDKIKEGVEYEIIITNVSGLYRYRMKDVVVMSGHYINTPVISFCNRRDLTISIMGEKTTEPALTYAVDKASKQLGIELVDYSVYADTDYTPVRYQYFVEAGKPIYPISPMEVRKRIEEHLSDANPSYGDKVDKGICSNLRVNFLQPESYALYKDMMVAAGTVPTQVKPVHIILNEKQRRFFFGLTEYSAEVML